MPLSPCKSLSRKIPPPSYQPQQAIQNYSVKNNLFHILIISCIVLINIAIYADFQSHVNQFQQQMINEAPFIEDFLVHVQMAYSSKHQSFESIGAKDATNPKSLIHKMPPFTTIKNIYAEIVPQREPGLGHIEITVTFKDQRQSERTNAFFANTEITYTALGSLGLPLTIPLKEDLPASIEHAIIGFSCKKKVNKENQAFATYKHDSHTIDMASMLPYPFNLCIG